jgi:ABC-2 type transport system permease protein
MAPLTLFPAPVQALAAALPFRWMLAFPVELLLGRLSPADAAIGLAVQASWLAGSLALLGVFWRTGLRKYTAVGA